MRLERVRCGWPALAGSCSGLVMKHPGQHRMHRKNHHAHLG